MVRGGRGEAKPGRRQQVFMPSRHRDGDEVKDLSDQQDTHGWSAHCALLPHDGVHRAA